MSNLLKFIVIVIASGVGLFLLIQLVPVERENPPVVTQVQWDTPQTEALFRRACADCHSNETVWPWYTRVAPASWLVAHDVEEGREHFNLSDLESGHHPLDEIQEELAETVYEGEMPMPMYIIMHPEASLSRDEQRALVDGLQRTLNATLEGR
jgi:hypothetical protein